MLNQNYEPLNVCRARRAVILLYQGKVEMLENGSGFIHSASHVDKYAKSSTDDLWLKTASVYQKSKKSNLWEKLHL